MTTGTELSEKFKQALQDLKEVVQGGSLSQDSTPEQHFESIQAIMAKVMYVGIYQDHMSKEKVLQYIENVAVKNPVIQRIEKEKTLLDWISLLFFSFEHDKDGAITENSNQMEKLESTPMLPHDQYANNAIYKAVHDKYFQCNEKERRDISRSDNEFLMMARTAITLLSGFGDDEQEAFGNALRLEIPKLPRGNEMLWDTRGDPLPEKTMGFDELTRRLDYLIRILFTAFSELYPEQHKKIMEEHFIKREQKEGGQPALLILNSSHEEIKTLPSLYHKCDEIDDFTEFDNVALPMIIDAIIIRRLTEKNSFVNRHRRQSIHKNLLVNITEKLGLDGSPTYLNHDYNRSADQT